MEGHLRLTPGLRIGRKAQFTCGTNPRKLTEEIRILDGDLKTQCLTGHLIGRPHLNTGQKISNDGFTHRCILIDGHHCSFRQRRE